VRSERAERHTETGDNCAEQEKNPGHRPTHGLHQLG
jgi:hypothetical protein